MGVTKMRADIVMLVQAVCNECGAEVVRDLDEMEEVTAWRDGHEFNCPGLDHFYRHRR